MVHINDLQQKVIALCQTLIYDDEVHLEHVNYMRERWGRLFGITIEKEPSIHSIKEESRRPSGSDLSSINDVKTVQEIDEAAESEAKILSQFTIHNIKRFPTGQETGLYIGVHIGESQVSLASLKCFGNSQLASHTLTVRSEGPFEHQLHVTAETLSKFVDEKKLAGVRMVLAVTHSLQEVPELSYQLLKDKIRKHSNLKNIFVRDVVITAPLAYLMLGIYQNPETKFYLHAGERVEIGMIRVVPVQNGIKRRSVISIDARALIDEETVEIYKGKFDDPYQFPDALVAGEGMPEVFRLYLLEAIKSAKILRGLALSEIKKPGSFFLEDMILMERPDPESTDQYSGCRHVLRLRGYEKVSDEDCIQVQFINRAILRRSFAILSSAIVGLVRRSCRESANITVGGVLTLYPKFGHYMNLYTAMLLPPWLSVNMTIMSTSDLPAGAGIFAAVGAQELIEREEAQRNLPHFQIYDSTAMPEPFKIKLRD